MGGGCRCHGESVEVREPPGETVPRIKLRMSDSVASEPSHWPTDYHFASLVLFPDKALTWVFKAVWRRAWVNMVKRRRVKWCGGENTVLCDTEKLGFSSLKHSPKHLNYFT